MRLWLVRHGSTDWSDDGRLTGWTDVPLNERGRAQAAKLAGAIPNIEFDGVWSSDLSRALQTAKRAKRGAVPDARLRELNFGALDGTRWELCAPDVQASMISFDDFQAPGGESTDELKQRVLDFTASIPQGNHLVFSHGGVIRVLLRLVGADRRVEPGHIAEIDLSGYSEGSRRDDG